MISSDSRMPMMFLAASFYPILFLLTVDGLPEAPAERVDIALLQAMVDYAASGELENCWLDEEVGALTLKPLLRETRPVVEWKTDLKGGHPWEIVRRPEEPAILKGVKLLLPRDRFFECYVYCSPPDQGQGWRRLIGPVLARGKSVLEWDKPFRTDALKVFVTRSAPSSDAKTHLSDLVPTEEKASFRKYRKDTDVYGNPLVIGGQRYEKGLGCHARSELQFPLDGQFAAFEADIGLSDTARKLRWGYVVFRVLLDEKTAFESPLLSWRDPPMHVGLVTQGAKTIRLVIDPGPSGSEPANRTDHAAWGGVMLHRAAGREPPFPLGLKLAALGVRYSPQGTFTSMPIGVGSVRAWGNIRCEADVPDGTSVLVQTRSGSTHDTSTAPWSHWSEPAAGPTARISCPLGRYLQYRILLSTRRPDDTPRLRKVTLTFDDGGARQRAASSRLGVCHMFASEYEYDKLAAFAQEAGIGLHRTSFDWDRIEWAKGEFDWRRMNTQLSILGAHDIGSIGLLWTDLPPNYSTGGHARPTDMEDWGRFVEATVRRYRDRISRWELWNEPDTGFYKGTLDEYRELLKTTYRSAKKADPDCLVSCGGMTPLGIFGWFEKLCEEGGWDAFDAVAYHPYTDADPPEHRIERFVYQVRQLAKRHGSRKRLWFTESGWQSGGGWLSARDEQQKAAYTVRNYVATLANGIDFTLIYRMATIEPDRPESDFGLLDATSVGKAFPPWRGQAATKFGKLSPKPAYEALRTASELLRDARFIGQLPVGDMRDAPGDGIHHRSAYAYVFEKDGQPVVVAYAFREDKGAVLQLNCGTNAARLVGMFGDGLGQAGEDGVLEAKLGPDPVYVVGARPASIRAPLCFDAASPGLMACAVGESMRLPVGVRNITRNDLSGTLAPVLPEGWQSEPTSVKVVCGRGKEGQTSFLLRPTTVTEPSVVSLRFSTDAGVFPTVGRVRALS